jgi:hypothetical protein
MTCPKEQLVSWRGNRGDRISTCEFTRHARSVSTLRLSSRYNGLRTSCRCEEDPHRVRVERSFVCEVVNCCDYISGLGQKSSLNHEAES